MKRLFKKLSNLKKMAILAIIILLMVSSSSCSCKCNQGPSNTPANLTYWRTIDDKAVFQPMFDSFTERNSNITVTYTKKDLTEYYSQLLDALASGTGPDIFSIRNDWLPAFKDKIDLVPSDIYTTDSFKETFVDVAGKDLIDDQGIWGIPLSVDSLALIYNALMLEDAKCPMPPKNWNQFMSCSKKLTRLRGNTVVRAGTALGTTDNLDTDKSSSRKLATDISSAMMMQSGDKMVSADNSEASFGLPVTKESGGKAYPGTSALEFYTSFARPIKDVYSWHSRMPNSVRAFSKSEVAMIFGYSDMIKKIEAKNPNLSIESAAIPQIKDSDTSKTSSTFWVEVVSKQSKSRTQAWQLLQYLSSADNENLLNSATKRPPSRKELTETVSSDMKYGGFAQGLTYADDWYKGKNPEKVYRIFAKMINGVLAGQKTQNAIDAARNDITSLFQAQKNL